MPARLDPGGAPALDQHPLGPAVGEDLGAVLLRIDEVGLGGRELRAGLIAEAEVGGALGVVAVAVGVADDGAKVPAEALACLAQALVRAVQVAAVGVRLEALEDRVEVRVEVGAVDAGEPVPPGPLPTHPVVRAQAVGPVDDRAAADRASGDH
jgi:hypothetical protein